MCVGSPERRGMDILFERKLFVAILVGSFLGFLIGLAIWGRPVPDFLGGLIMLGTIGVVYGLLSALE